MKKLSLLVLALSVGVLAAEGSLGGQVDGLQARIDRVLAKAGIHFGGEFRSQFLNSTLSGDALSDRKHNESVEFTSVDFDIVARPNTAINARAMFRLHQDWRNFFSDVQNPVSARWLSIDGSVAQGIFKYNAGDYKKKISPLTLWAPDLELLYEPEIFAQGREYAMSEAFLGENNRSMQGANISLRAELWGANENKILSELEADVFGARLATRGTGESAVTPPGTGTTAPNGEYWDADFDKYLLGLNLGTQVIDGAGLGLSLIQIYDYEKSFRGSSNIVSGDFETAARLGSKWTQVLAGRVNFDNRAFMSDDFIRVGIAAEAAFSSDKDSAYVDGNVNVAEIFVDGMAVNAGLSARLAFGESDALRLSADYIMNDAGFRNDAAQTPTYIQQAIMNNENSLSGLGVMNPFDAMYRTVFKYAPSQYFGGAKPYTKNAYNNAILTKEENARLGSNVFQTALPGGMATADRSGPVVKLDGEFLDRAITIGAKAAILNSFDDINLTYEYAIYDDAGLLIDMGTRSIPTFKADYLEAVGGASIDIAKFAPAVGPALVIGGSFGMYNSKTGRQLTAGGQKVAEEQESNSNLLSVALNYNFFQRFSLLLGYQQLTTGVETKTSGDAVSAVATDYTFDNLAFGLGYKVADGGNLTAKVTMVSGKRDIANAPENTKVREYKAFQPEVYLTVRF